MMKQMIAATVVAILATALGNAQEKRMTDNPGPEHADLVKLVGEYNTVSKFKLNPTDAGQEARACRNSPYFDGRFLLEEGDSEQFGQPLRRKLYGYNNAAKRYETPGFIPVHGALTLSGTSRRR